MVCTKQLIGSLSNQRKCWEKRLSDLQSQLDSLSVHSLLVSASCTYLGFLPPKEHESMWRNWVSYCSGCVAIGSLVVEEKGVHDIDIKIEDNFKCHSALASDGEKLLWERDEVFPDLCLLEKCLQWRTVSHYCGYYYQVVFDPLSFFDRYMNGLAVTKSEKANSDPANDSVHYISTDSSCPDLIDKLFDGAEQGKPVVIHVDPISVSESFTIILQQIMNWSGASLTLKGRELSPRPQFQVYLVFPVSPFIPPLHSVIHSLLQSTPAILLSSLFMSEEGLSSLFQSHILDCMRRELCTQRRASMADLNLHKKQVTKSQVCKIKLVFKKKFC